MAQFSQVFYTMLGHRSLDFRGEWPTFRYVEYYKSLARIRGLEVFTDYATAFAVPETSRRRRIQSLL